jgi:hypothetical protein
LRERRQPSRCPRLNQRHSSANTLRPPHADEDGHGKQDAVLDER